MIVDGIGDRLAAEVDALVNPINCTGVMGKGLALAFKRAFPEHFDTYRAACKRGDVQLGAMFVTESRTARPRWPGSPRWCARSARAFRSIAIPAIGCGLGGLDWRAVRSAIERAFAEADATVLLFTPR